MTKQYTNTREPGEFGDGVTVGKMTDESVVAKNATTASADKLEVKWTITERHGEREKVTLLVDEDAATRIIAEQAERIAELHGRLMAEGEAVTFYRAASVSNRRRAEAAEARNAVLEKALRAILDEETISVHVGYDNGVGGGNFIYADAVRTDSAAFANARAALEGQSNEA